MRPGIFIQTGIRKIEIEEMKKLISKLLPYSIVLFKSDFNDEKELKNLIKDIKKIYKIENNIDFPLFAVDQEGGNVVRIPWLDYSPGNLFLGKINNANFTKYVGMLTGYQLNKLGISWNLAPVLDLYNPYNNVIMERSFGLDVNAVSEQGNAYIEGIQSFNVMATAKHFPGHGSVLEDSHLTLPTDKRNYLSLINDLYPFKEAIKHNVSSIMLSHVIYENFDKDEPASLSKKIQNYLREELNFKNLIITDSVDMNAISKNYNYNEIVKNTILNGADIIEDADLYGSLQIYDEIKKVDPEKLKSHLNRILNFKINNKLRFMPDPEILKAMELNSAFIKRKVVFDLNVKTYIIFLDENNESNVSEKNNTSENIINLLDKTKIDFSYFNGVNILPEIYKNIEQLIFIGKNEHLKDRVNKINNFSKNKKCAYLSTGVDTDFGLFDNDIGYISCYSKKPYIIFDAIMKLFNLK